jgi:branched-chain amino acid transport system ATP-binding protein
VTAPLLVLEKVSGGYGLARVLFDVSLTMAGGEVVALLGRNGAGKSTLLKSIIGLLPGRSGSIRLEGRELIDLPPYRACRLGLGYVPEDRRIFADLTVAENLEAGRRPPAPGLAPWTPDRLFAIFPNLAPMAHRRGGAMSGGEQQMLSIARTLMGNPRLLLLDEPSEGLAPVIVAGMVKAVQALKATGVAILLAEQNSRFAGAVAERAYLLERGEVRHEASMTELGADPGIARALLGVEA